MTASFGITALNELQELYNGKSIAEDGQFALEVLQYINDKVAKYKLEDGILYAIYGTPAESLCGYRWSSSVKCPPHSIVPFFLLFPAQPASRIFQKILHNTSCRSFLCIGPRILSTSGTVNPPYCCAAVLRILSPITSNACVESLRFALYCIFPISKPSFTLLPHRTDAKPIVSRRADWFMDNKM